MRDMKIRHKTTEVENVRLENAHKVAGGGKYGT